MNPEEQLQEQQSPGLREGEKKLILDSLMTIAPALIGYAAGGQGGAALGARISEQQEGERKSAAQKYQEQMQKQAEYGLKEKEIGLKEQEALAERKFRADKLGLEKEELAAKRDIEAAKLAKGQDAKTLTGDQANTLADIESSNKQMASLEAAVADNADIMGPIAGTIYSASPWATKAKAFDAQLKIAAQTIGKALEGGVLKEQDIKRYREMLPNINDTSDLAKAKIAGVNQLLAQKRESFLDTMKRSGYGVGGFEQVAQQQGGPKAKPHDRVSGFGSKSAVASEMPDFDQMSYEELKKYLGR